MPAWKSLLNPIEIGGMIDEKMMMLDLKAELNDSRILDVEMQVLDLEYYFYNLDTAHEYSDKVSIRVLQLNQLDNEANPARGWGRQ